MQRLWVKTPSLAASACGAWLLLGESRRCFASTRTAWQQQQRKPLARKGAAAKKAPVTLATQLFSLREQHHHESMMCHEAQCQAIALAAWRVLETVSEDTVDKAPARDVAEMLAAWTYFSQFWERGLDGPSLAPATSSADDSSSDQLQTSVSLEALGVPVISRETKEARTQAAQRAEAMPPPPRRSPLDDVIEF